MTEDRSTDCAGGGCVLDGTAYNPALAATATCEANVASAAQVGYCPLQY